jgi:hypothetical protein
MTKEELWKVYVNKNPSFNGRGNVTMSAKGLRKLFDTTWDVAMFDGEMEKEEELRSYHSSSASLDSLKSIFGMK